MLLFSLTFLFCTGSGARSGSGAEAGQAQGEKNLSANGQREIQRMSTMHISKPACARDSEPVQEDHMEEPRGL